LIAHPQSKQRERGEEFKMEVFTVFIKLFGLYVALPIWICVLVVVAYNACIIGKTRASVNLFGDLLKDKDKKDS